VNVKTLRVVLESSVSMDDNLMTDEHSGYAVVGRRFASHGVTRHTASQYVDGDNHSNTVESSFSLLKRDLIGTFHHVGEQHLQRYVTEFDFRWSHRKVNDKERSDALLSAVSRKRAPTRPKKRRTSPLQPPPYRQ
jgi:hypothetical protein